MPRRQILSSEEQARLLVIPDDEIILTRMCFLSDWIKILLSLISTGVQLIAWALLYYSVTYVVLDLYRTKTIFPTVVLYPELLQD